MSKFDVQIVRMEPMRVACVCVVSASPEREAWERLKAWAEPGGFLRDPRKHPLFGFNNPGPTAGGKEYGYEFWLCIDPETEPGDAVEVKEFAGGRYAMTTHHGHSDPRVWRQLWDWVQGSPYRWRKTHELERIHDPLAPEKDVVFDLYLPIED
jgi:DNA gyrase inhibitor GyrI